MEVGEEGVVEEVGEEPRHLLHQWPLGEGEEVAPPPHHLLHPLLRGQLPHLRPSSADFLPRQ